MAAAPTADPPLTQRSADAGYVVVANESAGSAERERLGRALCVLAEDRPVRLHWSSEPADVARVARDAPDQQLVVFGGDGTIRGAAEQLVDAGLGDRPVALLPGGTGNDHVRHLGTRLDPEGAARQLRTAVATRRPVLAVRPRGGEERVAVNAVHVGVGALAARRSSSLKERLGPAAYPVGAIGAGVAASPWQLHVEVDDQIAHDGPSLMAAVLLGTTIGGGTDLVPDPGRHGGASAQLLVSSDIGPAERVSLAASLLSGRPWRRDAASLRRGRRITIRADPAMALNLDGEDLGDCREVDVEVRRDAWTVLVPHDRDG